MSVWTLSCQALTASLEEYKTEICFMSVEGSKPFTSGWDSDPFSNPEKALFNSQVNGVFL